MKPFKLTGEISQYDGYKAVRAALENNLQKDCVVGYYKTEMGQLFIIKSRVKFFCYLHYTEDMIRASNGR